MQRRHFFMRSAIGAVLIIFLIAGLLYPGFFIDLIRSYQPTAMKTASFTLGDRILIIAPHPDDETLGGGGVIEKALAAKKQVKVVIVTTGDGYKRAVIENFGIPTPKPEDYRRLGEARHLESLHAMQRLGLKTDDVLFLGYPDGGINGIWETNWDYNHPHLGLNGSVRSPYTFSYEKQAPYCGKNIVKNLTDIIRDFQPTDIVYPDPNDQNHDHWATNAFVKYVLSQQNYRFKEWTYLVHRGDFPAPWLYDPNLALEPPHALENVDTRWIHIPMSEQERHTKLAAIHEYVTQMKVMDPFLVAFVRKNELLGTYKDPSLPIVQGPLKFSDPQMSHYLLFPDAIADTVKRDLEASADITATGAVLSENRLHIGFDTKAPIHREVVYNVRIRFIQPDGIRRLDVSIQNFNMSSTRFDSNSLALPNDADFQIHDHHLWITLPASVMERAKDMMISVDTSVDSVQIDKTAWRMIKITK